VGYHSTFQSQALSGGFVTYSQTPIFEQSPGIPFDSTDFTMNISPIGTLFALPCTTSMEDWTEEEDSGEDSEVDTGLEDGGDGTDTNEEGNDDTFEQYHLFGEDDE